MADPRICAAPGCDKPARRNRYSACSMHEARMRRGGSWERRVEKLTLTEILGGRMLFGLWQVLGEAEPYLRLGSNEPMRRALCRCACGVERPVAIHTLKRGQSKHCGCRQAIFNDASHLRHGDTRRGRFAVEHGAWSRMIGRCENPNDQDYANYGGRGIVVCRRWRESYEAFLADMGRRPEGLSLDRIDPNGNYEPGNCRWADKFTQAQNRRTAKIVEYEGEQVALVVACRRAGRGHRYKVIHQRMKRGLSFAEALAADD